jgi:hypothetical protein
VLVICLRTGADTAALLLLGFAALTDVADGWVARRLRATSAAGAYLDVTVDFLLVSGGLGALAARGVYPSWLVLVPGLVFAVFLLSSGPRRPVYDPVGKSYGGLLFGVLVASVLLPISRCMPSSSGPSSRSPFSLSSPEPVGCSSVLTACPAAQPNSFRVVSRCIHGRSAILPPQRQQGER